MGNDAKIIRTVSLRGARTKGAIAIEINNTVKDKVNSSRETPKRSCPAGLTMATWVQFAAHSIQVINEV